MSQVILEKLDAIEAKQAEAIQTVEAKIPEAIAAVQAEMSEKFSAFEAKLAVVQAPAIIRAPAKTVRGDVNRSVKEQIANYYTGGRNVEKELKMFEDESQYDAYLQEASSLTAGGDGKGGLLHAFLLPPGSWHTFHLNFGLLNLYHYEVF